MKEYKNKTWFNVLVVLVIAVFVFIAASPCSSTPPVWLWSLFRSPIASSV